MHLIDANDKRNRLYVSQEVFDCMQRIPPIDPESLRPQGEWKFLRQRFQDGGYWDEYGCSECDHVKVVRIGGWLSNCCPNCGAYMKGGTP